MEIYLLSSRPSMESSRGSGESQSGQKPVVDCSSDGAPSEWSTSMEMSDASSNRTEATAGSGVKAYDLQKSLRTLTRRSSLRLAKGLTRMSSSKLRRSSSKKISGGADFQRKKLKKWRSVRLAGFQTARPSRRNTGLLSDQPLGSLSDKDAFPNYLKSTRCSDVKKVSSQASPRDSELSVRSNDQNGKRLSSFKPKQSPSSNKSVKGLTRTPTLRPVRILTKMASLKPKRPSAWKQSQISQSSDSSIHRPTCSSAIRGAKISDKPEIPQEGDLSKRILAKKFCPYSYCSLHGHHRHGDAPKLKRLRSARKRVNAQESKKLEGQPPRRVNNAGNSVKGKELSKIVHQGQQAVEEEIGNATTAVQKLEGEVPVQIYTGPKADPNGVVAQERGEAQPNSLGLVDINSVDIMSPHESFGESTQQACLYSEEQHVLVHSLALNEKTHFELRRSGSEFEMDITDSSITQKNEEERSSVSCDTGGGNVVLDEDQAASPAVCQLKPADGGLFHESFESINVIETCHSEDSQYVNIVREVDGEEPSCLESELHLAEPAINGGNTTLSDSMADEIACTSDVCISSEESARASKDELFLVSELKGEDAAAKFGDSELDDPFRTPRGTKKYNGLWYLIYQHMVSDIAETGGSQPFNLENEKERVKDSSTLPGVDGTDCCEEVSDRSLDIEMPTNEEDRQPMELCQSDAIKLLQEAINKILLSQSPVRKFDSKSSNDTDMEEPGYSDEKDGSQGAIRSSRTSTSPELQNGVAPESKEEQVRSENHHTRKEETKTKIWKKPNQPTLTRWSNVKKLILLKRFVKALEKTRKFKPKMPRSPSSDLYQEAEKVSLRRQSTEERKKSEEWMLDYALQKVISNLDPAQRRKVALLVEAFETVVPAQGGESPKSPNSSFSSPVRRAKANISCSVLDDKPKDGEDGHSSGTQTGKSSNTYLVAQSSDSATDELENPLAFSEAKITGQDFCTISRELSIGMYNENPMKNSFSSPDAAMTKSTIASDLSDECLKAENSENEIDIELSGDRNVQEEQARKIPSSNLLPEGADAGSNRKSFETKGLMGETVTILNDSEGDPPEVKEESEPADPSPVGGKKYNGLWHLIYQHMVSDIAESGGSQTFNLENEKDCIALPGVDEVDHRQEVSKGAQDIGAATDDENQQQMELCQTDVIKLLQEAINKILLSQSPHQKFDGQPTGKDTKLEGRCYADERDGGRRFSKSSGISASPELQNGAASDSIEQQFRTENLHTMKKQTESKIWHKPNQPTLRRWSSVKKFILLKKFVKALETSRHFKPRIPRSPSSEVYTESEKVSLRQQSIEERKKSEEWMLDYALRKVISDLDPAQKRKVGLLVEAFETVIPTQGGESPISPNMSFSYPVLCAKANMNCSVQDDKPIASEDGYPSDTLAGKSSSTYPVSQSSNSPTKEQENPVAFSEAKRTSLDFCTMSTELSRVVYDMNIISLSNPSDTLRKTIIPGDLSDRGFNAENSENGQECAREAPSLNSPPEGADAGSNCQSAETEGSLDKIGTVFNNAKVDSPEDDNAESTNLKGLSPLASVDDTLEEEPMTTSQEGKHGADPKVELPSDSSPHEESMLIRVTNAEPEIQLENKKYSHLWYLIHKHMVSGLNTEDGSGSPLDGTSKEDKEEENKLDGRHGSCPCQDSPELKDQQLSLGQRADREKMELRKIEAIKLVQEAIDNILLPEAEESSLDGQFSSKNIQYEKTECAETLISTLNNTADDGRVESERTEQPRASDEETQLQFITVSGASPEANRMEPKVASKFSQAAVKNWSNLKKVILLRRFVKALEKVRNLNLRQPQHLPPQPHDEPEIVNLRHQDMVGRKNTEEWMLDYALQQVVSRLTPARRRKVHLLVEAFETVSPPIGN